MKGDEIVTNNQLTSLIVELYDIRQKKSELDKLEKAALEALKPLADPEFDALPGQPIVSGDILFSRSSGESRTIKGDLLLERGVSPDVVFYATVTTRYFRYLTSVPKVRKAK